MGSGSRSEPRRVRGFSLVELLVVLTILAIVAAALQTSGPFDASGRKAELAAEEVASALRYARSEAIRLGTDRFGSLDPSTGRVYAARPDLTSGEVVLVDYLTNPFDQRPYDFHVGNLPGALGTELTGSTAFLYRDLSGAETRVVFDAVGHPYLLVAGTRHPLTSGTVELQHGDSLKTVRISSLGRVTLE